MAKICSTSPAPAHPALLSWGGNCGTVSKGCSCEWECSLCSSPSVSRLDCSCSCEGEHSLRSCSFCSCGGGVVIRRRCASANSAASSTSSSRTSSLPASAANARAVRSRASPATMPGAMRFSGKLRHPFQQKPRDTDLRDEPLRLTDADGKRGLPFRVLKEKSLRISVKPLAEPQDLQPLSYVAGRGYRNRQPEAIQKLAGTELSFFRVHRTDKNETRRMFCGDAFPPNTVDALGTGFEDDVRHMIRKQIDFIYIQNATVRGLRAVRAEGHARPHGTPLPCPDSRPPGLHWRTREHPPAGAQRPPTAAPPSVFFPRRRGKAILPGASGSQCHGQPATTWDCGRSEARPRTAVDFAVPFSPRSNTPPILGKTALASKARLIFSRPTRAVKGNTRHLPDITAPPSLILTFRKGFLLILCGRTSRAACMTSSLAASPSPRHAAMALTVFSMTISALCPSTSVSIASSTMARMTSSGNSDAPEFPSGGDNPFGYLVFPFLPCGTEAHRIIFKGRTARHHLKPRFRFRHAPDLHAQTEPVEKLRAEFPFFRVHRSNKHKTGRMRPKKRLHARPCLRPSPPHPAIRPQGGHPAG